VEGLPATSMLAETSPENISLEWRFIYIL